MAFDYLISENVEVFPSTGRTYNPGGKFTSEHNFINIIKSTTDEIHRTSAGKRVYNDGYIVNHTTVDGVTNLRCVIHGYLFVLDLSIKANTWLGILVRNDDERLVAWDVVGNDLDGVINSNSVFKGIVAITSESDPTEGINYDGYTRYYLQISDATGEIIQHAKHKISSAAVEYKNKESVQTKLDNLDTEKQDKLIISTGLTLDADGVTLQLDNGINTYVNDIKNTTAGSVSRPIVWTNGKPVEVVNGNIGSEWTKTEKYFYRTNTIMKDGEWVEGNTTFASIYEPTTEGLSSLGKDGDIWIRYS